MPAREDLADYGADELVRELRLRDQAEKAGVTVASLGVDTGLRGFAAVDIARTLRDKQKLVYGTDDRQDLFQVTDPALRRDADSVVCLIEAGAIGGDGDGTSMLLTEKFAGRWFRQGAFQGASPRQAYLVKCDSETTTQADIDLGVVNIIVGFAPLKPAEFVVIKITQLAGQLEA